MERLGGHPEQLLERFAIPTSALAADDGLISVAAHDRLLDATACELGCPDLGLQLADAQDLCVIGPLALAIESAASVADAVARASEFMFVHSPALSVVAEVDPRGHPDVAALAYHKDIPGVPYSPQATELGLGIFDRVARSLLRDDLGLDSVEIPHDPISAPERYNAFFGVPVHFGGPTACLRVERWTLTEQFHSAGPAIRSVAMGYLESLHPEPAPGAADQVRLALGEVLGASSVAITSTARLLGLNPRTLQRRLAEEGTSYGQVLDEVRRDAAYRLITTTGLPFGQVASMVGFTEQSALSRAVRRWHGASPRDLRVKAASEETTAPADGFAHGREMHLFVADE
ncbi:AraC family transcriptional regulator ligand-binding domain-containing protein [Luteipulveratus sp. YIM 133132]|uniref:AraC family transcriptional regulator n=1 Tax=Luteipulveratus flavus TaxID=3031728 RepID=UPI0023AE9631|nr:AraC family transcriptional regulator [Luteipulveratus sp. YIM 133132]MDE9365360.1 AraC family transcriptional regulator ligand-binding domain-containing protein [Luteipulveratus sp. YIM 133132]